VARIFPANGSAARLDARGEEEREGKRERLRSGFIGRSSVVEREGEVHARPQTNDAGRAATTISGSGERLEQMAGQCGMAGRGQRSSGKRRHGHRGGTWHGLEWRGAAGAQHMAGEAAAGCRAERNQNRAEQRG
jgi:hypothetical protein